MQKEILDALYEPFELKARPGQGGQTFKYVPSDDIVDRMNQVFKGDWSTEVVEKEVIEDQILIRVRVIVKDPMDQDSMVYWQEGYASQAIARFTQGVRSGQIIDVGNSYKSAMSKAIKTAVARWGVGLYLEKGSTDEADSPDVNSDAGNAPFFPGINNAPAVSPTVPKVEQSSPPVKSPVAEPVNMPSNSNIPFDIPFDTSTSKPAAPGPIKEEADPAPVFTDNNVVVTKGPGFPDFTPPVDSMPKSGVVENLTDVQKAAIDNIMSVHGKTFSELSAAALQRTSDLPASVESLSYQDAVKLIQYGNNLNSNV